MISYIRHNSVFDLGSRTGVSTCTGLYAELDDIYSKYINPQVRVQYDNTDCLCNMSGKQTLEGGSHAFVFHNGSISVTVDEQDNVTVAEADSGSGGGGGAFYVTFTGTAGSPIADKTLSEIQSAYDSGMTVIFVDNINASQGGGVAVFITDNVHGVSFYAANAISGVANNIYKSYMEMSTDGAYYTRERIGGGLS